VFHAYVDYDDEGRLVKKLVTDYEWHTAWFEIWKPFFDSKPPFDPDAWDTYISVMDDIDKFVSVGPLYRGLIAEEAHDWAYRTSLAKNMLKLKMAKYGNVVSPWDYNNME